MIVAKDRFREQWFSSNLHATATQQPTPKNYRDRRSLAAGQNDARPVPYKARSLQGPHPSRPWLFEPDGCRTSGRTRLFLFHHALQGMLVLARKIHHLRHLGLGDFVREHPALTDT